MTLEEERRRQAKASLDRYPYHYERWAASRSSLRMALTDMAQLERSGLEDMAAAVGLDDKEKLGFITAAYEQITDGRQVLQWTHAYGYYLDPRRDRKKRELFDHLQDQANSCLERLHGCVELERREIFCADGEADVVAELLIYYKNKVVQLTKTTRTFLGNLGRAFETDLPELSH